MFLRGANYTRIQLCDVSLPNSAHVLRSFEAWTEARYDCRNGEQLTAVFFAIMSKHRVYLRPSVVHEICETEKWFVLSTDDYKYSTVELLRLVI